MAISIEQALEVVRSHVREQDQTGCSGLGLALTCLETGLLHSSEDAGGIAFRSRQARQAVFVLHVPFQFPF